MNYGDPLLSIVVPLFNEEPVVDALYSRLTGVLDGNRLRAEVILVNDGSTDGTMQKVRGICQRDRRFRVLSFSRNFGHQFAISAGIDRASGDAVVVMDADLQDPPEVILDMLRKWREGFDVVHAVRRERKGESYMKRATAALFYRVLRRLTDVEISVDAGDFRLMDRKVVAQLKQMRERFRFVRGMVSWVGFRQGNVEYVREDRYAGETKYPWRKMIRFALDAIFSFSQVPLRISSALGFLASALAFIFMIYGVVVRAVFPERAVAGWASIFVAMLFLGGVQLISVGILGEYLGRIYDEVKRRPLYIADEEINFPAAGPVSTSAAR
ncbi:MAG: glycosyltransferase [Acidobacteria bacterium]|nr:MAG: glycosyltransferase [Acidobacteriota bacterium]